jgi:hypothetical protein
MAALKEQLAATQTELVAEKEAKEAADGEVVALKRQVAEVGER